MDISTKFSYEDLQLIPPDRNRYELVDGDLLVTPAPIPLHQRILSNLHAQLWQFTRRRRLGQVLFAPIDVVFSSATVFEPDLIFVSRERLEIIGDKNLSGPPDLVVEVLSESTAQVDREVKSKQYARYGVQEFWLIDPAVKSVEVYRLQQAGYGLAAILGSNDVVTSPLFPGLSLSVSSLWET